MKGLKKMIIEVSKAQRMWSGTAQRSKHGMNSKKVIKEHIIHYKLRELDEEALKATVRTAAKDGSPGDGIIKFVFLDASDETSCIAGKRLMKCILRCSISQDSNPLVRGNHGVLASLCSLL